MDPITHGIIGMGLSALSSEPTSLTNPITIGCVLGAIAPDVDVVTKYKGDYEYLKHHRGISHSIPGLGIISLVISLGLSLVFREYSFFSIFFWTFLGSLSHSVFDIFNSYGVRFLFPFTKRKIAANILMLYDPFITFMCFLLIFSKGDRIVKISYSLTFLTVYIGFRLYLRLRVTRILNNRFMDKYNVKRINVLPAMVNPFKWDFIVETESHNIVGQINSLNSKIKIRKKLARSHDKLISFLKQTELGRYFIDFTPFSHIKVIEDGEKILLRVIDLRYYFKNDFMHHATIILDNRMRVIKEIFHPYNPNNNILVNSREVA